MAAEIVDDDDIAGIEGRDEDLLDIGEKAIAVDQPVDDARSGDAIAAVRAELRGEIDGIIGVAEATR